ncbi:hypothetical protein CH063_13031 [Colletotrichum higginsianum]|uniref:F-box domain-containing protein n=2 Tax=Colletotrichum higginsianum TaxID=80884 RepID=H1VSS3_COLHI|nr:hypothetical protein CH63R_11661 [Colletotrichum higginsianum IMI 349063]OBR04958.1 hypothetical protein CH63R_11661 [Colletotrichum higginsianum IMI 349063]TIC93938.1 hypothetical protein CH35J_009367 [Colletotrichum higginsianum]CCF43281.1 hypothetical protein CH063_13031 [Colletotrichum higginsianum]
MSFLPAHLLLLVAEHADFAGIQALRATCKNNRALLDGYEHAVTRLNAARYPCAPCNHILASDTREREVLPKDTYETIRELEARQHNIDEIVYGAYLAFWDEIELQDVSKADVIRENLKRALWQCSTIADLETHSIMYRDDIVPRRDPCVKSLINQDIILSDAPPPDGWHLALKEVHESNRQDVRFRQIAHIRELPVQELAGIVALAHLTSQGYMRFRAPRSGLSRPDVVEMGVCMAENTIRHGVFFLHSKVRGDEDANHHAKLLLDDTYDEMRRWESGDPSVLPGLTMNVAATLCEKVGCEHREMLSAACTLLRGDVWRPADAEKEEAEPEAEREKPDGEIVQEISERAEEHAA